MHTLLFVSLLLLLSCAYIEAFFGRKKDKKDEENKISGKDSAALGMMGLRDMAENMSPEQMRELEEAMKDPETMKEVQKLMADPEFKREMEKVTNDPHFAKAMHTAGSVLGQETAASVYKQMNSEQKHASDFDLGMNEMAKAAKNPKLLAEALEMLKDPEIAKEVDAMMKDPAFLAEARKMSADPKFKAAMGRASDDIERLSKDPAVLNKLKAQMQ